ncbi:MAG: C40 family peptidase [Alphaproteobacteria bacterium]|nr:C40 family peptidase [Alphaproteobacteria bacterium]
MRGPLLLLALSSAAAAAATEPVPDDAVRAVRVEVFEDALADAALSAASEQLGTPYRWNGRDTARLPGLDCLGLLFVAYGPATDTPWSAYPVNPSELVAGEWLGPTVEGTPAMRRDLDVGDLQPGDVLYFLMEGYEIPDAPLWVRGQAAFWPWHTALYVGGGEVLHAAPGDEVRRQALDSIAWDALLATRPALSAPR